MALYLSCSAPHSLCGNSFVARDMWIEPMRETITTYWDFDPEKAIRYQTDAQYEEHFRAVFADSVERRLISDRPILAGIKWGNGFLGHRLRR